MNEQLAIALNRADMQLRQWKAYDCTHVSNADLAQCQDKLETISNRLGALSRCEYDREHAVENELAHANANAEKLKRRVGELDDSDYWGIVHQLTFNSIRTGLARLLGLTSLEWYAAAMLIAAIPCALCIPIVVLLKLTSYWAIGIPVLVFYELALVAGVFLHSLDHSPYADRIDELAQWMKKRRSAIEEARSDYLAARADYVAREAAMMAGVRNEHAAATEHLARLKFIRQLQDRFDAANDEVKRLRAIMASRQYQLAQRDWRSLRGVPFEQFLSEVFQSLGYVVGETKITGDQGVDLILTGKEKRIAVQAKGWSAAVGNGAIQEVYSGMAFYKCDCCVVVTNSRFTASAQELANHHRCLLIDGQSISDLIAGRIPLEAGPIDQARAPAECAGPQASRW